jgi:hypothetical protein
VETGSISSEVRVGSNTSVDTEIGTCLDTTLSTVLNCADLIHVNGIDVVECFVSLSELCSVRGRTTLSLAVLDRLCLCVSLP